MWCKHGFFWPCLHLIQSVMHGERSSQKARRTSALKFGALPLSPVAMKKEQWKHQCGQVPKSPLELISDALQDKLLLLVVFFRVNEPQLHLVPVPFLASCSYVQVVSCPLVSTGLVSTCACCSTYQASSQKFRRAENQDHLWEKQFRVETEGFN